MLSMPHRSSRFSSARASLCAALALAVPLGCAGSEDKKEDAAEQKADDGKGEGEKTIVEAKADEVVKVADKAAAGGGGLAAAVAEGVSAVVTGGRLDRGVALGHFMIPNASGLLEKVRTKATPAKQSAFLNEEMLRSLAGMQLAERSAIAQHVSLADPMGCVLLDDPPAEVSVACVMGYEGGAAAAVTDVGEKGKQADAGGHTAHYRIDGEDIFVDDLGGRVVVSNKDTSFAKAKGYIESNMIGRIDAAKDDIELVAYPSALMKRYSDEMETLMSTMSATPSTLDSGNPFADAFSSYTKASTEQSFDYYRDIDQFEFGLGLQDIGLVMRYAIYPKSGSKIQSDVVAIMGDSFDDTFVTTLPAESWMVAAYSMDWNKAWSSASAALMRDAMTEAYAKELGLETEAVRTSIETYMTTNQEIYGDEVAMAAMHLPGTQGGLVMTRNLDKPGRESWVSWSEGFGAKEILGPEASEYVTWSFSPKVMEVEGVTVDRWTVEPGATAKAEMAKKPDPALKEIEKRFGGLAVQIDRVELDDRAMFIIAPGAQEQYVKAAILAAKGGAGVGSDPGFKTVMARQSDPSMVMAFDGAGMLSWMREVLPPEASSKIPPGLGADLSDVFMIMDTTDTGVQHVEMVMNQTVIDQLRALAD